MKDAFKRIQDALFMCEYRAIPIESIILSENMYCWLRANSKMTVGALPTLLGRTIKPGGYTILAPQSFNEGGSDNKLVTLRLGVL